MNKPTFQLFSCLVDVEYRVLNTLGFSDSWPKKRRALVTVPACALYQLFVRFCNLAHDEQHCSHFCTNAHRSLLLHHISLWCLCLSLSLLRRKNQNVLWNHSCTMSDSLSAPHSSQQSHDGTVSTSVQPLVYTQETIGNMFFFVSRPQLPHGSSAHIFLRAPLAKSQAKQRQLRSLRPSRSSYSLNSYSATTT